MRHGAGKADIQHIPQRQCAAFIGGPEMVVDAVIDLGDGRGEVIAMQGKQRGERASLVGAEIQQSIIEIEEKDGIVWHGSSFARVFFYSTTGWGKTHPEG